MMADTLDTLIEQLQSTDIQQRSNAIFQLEPDNIRDDRAVDVLVNILCTDDDLNILEDATWVLARYGATATLPLLNQITHANPRARHNIVHALGKIADNKAIPALLIATQDSDVSVRQKAVYALGQIGDIRAIDALIIRLGDDVQDVQWTAREVLETFGKKATPRLIHALTSTSIPIRELSASLLGDIGDASTITPLIDALETDAWQVRFAIVEALGAIGDRQALPAIEQMTKDVNLRVRTIATAVSKTISNI